MGVAMKLYAKALIAVGALALSGAAVADDPKDPEMQTAEAVALDREMIRQLNEDMLAQVTARDAGYAQGWQDYAQFKAGTHPAQVAYRQNLATYEREREQYADSRSRYERDLARWREDVRACRAGYFEACGN